MFLLVKVSPRKYMVVQDNGHMNVYHAFELDPSLAHYGEVVFGPASYSEASTYFVDRTKLPQESQNRR